MQRRYQQYTLIKILDNNIQINILNDGDCFNVIGLTFKAVDMKAKKNALLGFETTINNKKICFLGDENCNPELYDKIRNSDYVMHEAFCLDSEEKIFKPYEKHHSTVKSACKKMNDLNIKNLILYHTEETHIENRKELYLEEGRKYFNNNILIPDEMEEIQL